MRTPITFKLTVKDDIAVLEFRLSRPLTPADLKGLSPPDPVKLGFADRILVVSGRGPIWLYGALLEFYHPLKAVAFYDPRLNGAVVVATHTPDHGVGDLVPAEKIWDS
jgi:CRISPR-associated protein Csx3